MQSDVRESEIAIESSQGDKTLKVDLSSTSDNLYVGTVNVGTPG
jgi:hypothetical protein